MRFLHDFHQSIGLVKGYGSVPDLLKTDLYQENYKG